MRSKCLEALCGMLLVLSSASAGAQETRAPRPEQKSPRAEQQWRSLVDRFLDGYYGSEQATRWLKTFGQISGCLGPPELNSHRMAEAMHYVRQKKQESYRRALDLDLLTKDVPGKQKALLVLPYNDSTCTFQQVSIKDVLHELKEHYNFDVLFAETEDDVYSAVTKKQNCYSRLFIAGHGMQHATGLGVAGFYEPDEKYNLDTSDFEEIKHSFQGNKALERIDFISCSVAQGGDEADNMINMTARAVPGVVVVGSKRTVLVNHIAVTTEYPYRLRFIADADMGLVWRRDSTYTAIMKPLKPGSYMTLTMTDVSPLPPDCEATFKPSACQEPRCTKQ